MWTVTGSVTLSPELASKIGETDVLFVTARVPGARMPVAVARIPSPAYPAQFELRSGHAAEGTGAMPAALEIAARVSRSGMAGPAQPGDLEGTYPGRVPPGAAGVHIVIDSEQ